ncbi:hypothetical protein PsYK624_111420 [Phanerochaete sordida]|uniref:Protein kinase domain-containing protein n=1 Tax=Phanerochaete sordida TaxID=48140 RepID=A0A9P3GK00_9APHY|nr:hypothetical protein PsYK624_111420 [Phanerochaete sordida]
MTIWTAQSALLPPSASEKYADADAADSYFPHFSPPHALDLANASLEYNPFAASTPDTYSPDAPSFDITDSPFEYLDARYEGPSQALTPADPCALAALPALSISSDALDALDTFDLGAQGTSLLFASDPPRPDLQRAAASENLLHAKGRMYSPRFPADHTLNPFFVTSFELGDELGAGGYGFVMTARHRTEGFEVAVKFIIKDKVPEHAWWDDDMLGRVPTEVMIMSLVDHENIVKCLDLFEDELYFYLVQELHGTPWMSRKKKPKQITAPGKLVAPSPTLSTPSLTPSPSTDTNVSLPATPPQVTVELPGTSEAHSEPPKIVSHDSDVTLVSDLAEQEGVKLPEDNQN